MEAYVEPNSEGVERPSNRQFGGYSAFFMMTELSQKHNLLLFVYRRSSPGSYCYISQKGLLSLLINRMYHRT